MAGRHALWAPLAASVLAHAALIAALAGGVLPVSDGAPRAPAIVPIGRAPAADASAPVGRSLRLLGPDGLGGGAAAGGEAVIPLDSADPRYRPYLVGVQRRIWERWSAPSLAGGDVARGVLVVEFRLARSGRLTGSEVREPSGVLALDRAALDAIARAEPFTPLPEAIDGESLRVRARFVYD